MVLTVSSALSPVIGLVCHRRLADTSTRLDAGVEASGPHDFAVRESAVRLRHCHVHRIPLRVRDDRETPLRGDGTESKYSCFYPAVKLNSEIPKLLAAPVSPRFRSWPDHFRSTPINKHSQDPSHVSNVPEAAISRRLISRCIKGSIDLITICPVSWRQRELKQSTPWLVFARPQPSAVFFDDGAADRQSHAHAAGFCRVEWLER
jgi:hypothetical protein